MKAKNIIKTFIGIIAISVIAAELFPKKNSEKLNTKEKILKEKIK